MLIFSRMTDESGTTLRNRSCWNTEVTSGSLLADNPFSWMNASMLQIRPILKGDSHLKLSPAERLCFTCYSLSVYGWSLFCVKAAVVSGIVTERSHRSVCSAEENHVRLIAEQLMSGRYRVQTHVMAA